MTSSGLAESPALEVAVPRRKRTRTTQCRASRLHFVEHLLAAREPAKASSDMSVLRRRGDQQRRPSAEVIDLMVKNQRVECPLAQIAARGFGSEDAQDAAYGESDHRTNR